MALSERALEWGFVCLLLKKSNIFIVEISSDKKKKKKKTPVRSVEWLQIPGSVHLATGYGLSS